MSPLESRRFNRLADGARREFLVSRWLIRQALSSASGQDGASCRPVDGRPDASASPPGYGLSLSHSGNMAGCAVTNAARIGLDIEPLARRPHWQKVVSRWFVPEEQAWLLARSDSEAFLQVWTLKEAWLKATGRGIANNLQTLCITDRFELLGDRPGENWRASLGQLAGFLVAVVHKSLRPPESFHIPGAVDIANPGVDIAHEQAIDWMFHQPIHAMSEPT